MNKKVITISLDPYYWELFKYYADQEGRSLSNFLEISGREHIRKANEGKNEKDNH